MIQHCKSVTIWRCTSAWRTFRPFLYTASAVGRWCFLTWTAHFRFLHHHLFVQSQNADLKFSLWLLFRSHLCNNDGKFTWPKWRKTDPNHGTNTVFPTWDNSCCWNHCFHIYQQNSSYLEHTVLFMSLLSAIAGSLHSCRQKAMSFP